MNVTILSRKQAEELIADGRFPENSAVIVFNKFDEVIYTSHNRDAGKVLPMPKDGKVVFLGQRGDTFAITV